MCIRDSVHEEFQASAASRNDRVDHNPVPDAAHAFKTTQMIDTVRDDVLVHLGLELDSDRACEPAMFGAFASVKGAAESAREQRRWTDCAGVF